MINRDEVRRRLQEGKTPAEIAAVMNCSVGTIRRAKKELEEGGVKMDYKNPEGYADPTAFHAMNPDAGPGDVWEVTTKNPGETQIKLFLQVFVDFAIVLGLQPTADGIPEGCDAKIICKGCSGFVDMSKPQVVFFNRLIGKAGEIGLTRLITIRQGAASIILRGYPDEKPALATEKAHRSDSKPELDKIPTEEEKPQETAGNTLEQEDAIRAVLQYKAASLEALTNRLLDIVERAVQKGA